MIQDLRAMAPCTAIAIPAKNEAAHIAACLTALAAQTVPPDHIVLCVNNTTDSTVADARSVRLPAGTRLHIHAVTLPPSRANAGTARRIAMDAACALAGDGVVLTTDADGVADTTWLEANLRNLSAGADAVAGWVDLDAASWHQIPLRLHEDDARECAYDSLCDEIVGLLDPDPADPLPRHTQHSGASLAVWTRFYRACGGLPALASGEDRALVEALRRIDARIRHAPDVHVTVSGRMVGRAAGGMADTIRRRLTAPDLFIDDRLEPAEECARRARLRASLRASLRAGLRTSITYPASFSPIAAMLGADRLSLARALRANPFGAVWAQLEATAPVLARTRVAVADLPEQTRSAQALRDALRATATAAPLAMAS